MLVLFMAKTKVKFLVSVSVSIHSMVMPWDVEVFTSEQNEVGETIADAGIVEVRKTLELFELNLI